MLTVQQIGIAFDIVVIAFLLYVAFMYYREWREHSDLPFIKRVFKAAYDSGTILWTKVCVVLSVITDQMLNLADLIGGQEMRDAFAQWFPNPRIISSVILAITAITYFARMRRTSVDPIK